MTSVCVNSVVVDNSVMDDSVWNEEDENRIAEYYNNLKFEIEQELFLIELKLANMQPNTAYGLWVVDQEIKYKSAVIIEDCREEGYCIAKFTDDIDTIYVPALDGTYNSYLNEGMEVMIQAFNTPGLIHPWRSKKVVMDSSSVEFTVNHRHRNALAVVIGNSGENIEQIKYNSLDNNTLPKPKIYLTNVDNYNIRVRIEGVSEMYNLDIIKQNITECLTIFGHIATINK